MTWRASTWSSSTWRAGTWAGESYSVSPPSIPSAEAFGNATVTFSYLVSVSGIPSAEAFGTPTFVGISIPTISPPSIPSAEVFGVPTVTAELPAPVTPTIPGAGGGAGPAIFYPAKHDPIRYPNQIIGEGIPSGEEFGTPSVRGWKKSEPKFAFDMHVPSIVDELPQVSEPSFKHIDENQAALIAKRNATVINAMLKSMAPGFEFAQSDD